MTDLLSTPDSLREHVLLRAGCPLHFWAGGPEARSLVAMMHGATMDHRMFNAQVEALIPEYRVLTWDARGHGKSVPIGDGFSLQTCAGDMLAILDELGVSEACVCGQSLGGYVAQHIYMLDAPRVRAMIIIGSTPIAKAYSRLEIWALKASLPLFRLWPYQHFTRTISHYTAVTPVVQEYALQACRQVDPGDFATIWKAVTLAVDEKGTPDLTLDVPLLLLHGDSDRTGTIRRDMPRWSEWENDVIYYVIPDAGHNANQDNPEFTNRVILEFLRASVDRSLG